VKGGNSGVTKVAEVIKIATSTSTARPSTLDTQQPTTRHHQTPAHCENNSTTHLDHLPHLRRNHRPAPLPSCSLRFSTPLQSLSLGLTKKSAYHGGLLRGVTAQPRRILPRGIRATVYAIARCSSPANCGSAACRTWP
jgi:hypothetical protein